MFINTVMNINNLTKIERTIMHDLANIYQENLPDTLYLNHYELEHSFGYTHKEWSKFLKIKEISLLIESELASISEVAARYALQNLTRAKATSADISAARELIANSQLLKQKHNQRPQVILTRIPEKEELVDG